MPGQPDRRYFDRDLRENPDLLDIAIDYAWNYPGDWEPLVAARELVRMTDSLPLPTARLVLNCMRADPHVAGSLPPPPRLTVVRSEEERFRPRRPDPPRRPVKREPPTPTFINVPIRVKATFGISAHRGYKTHLVGDVECVFSQHKNLHGRPSDHPRYPWAHFRVRWLCQPWQYTEWPHLFLDPPENADFCRACQEAVEEAMDAANDDAYAALRVEEDQAASLTVKNP